MDHRKNLAFPVSSPTLIFSYQQFLQYHHPYHPLYHLNNVIHHFRLAFYLIPAFRKSYIPRLFSYQYLIRYTYANESDSPNYTFIIIYTAILGAGVQVASHSFLLRGLAGEWIHVFVCFSCSFGFCDFLEKVACIDWGSMSSGISGWDAGRLG
jgi:hypothetical protein